MNAARITALSVALALVTLFSNGQSSVFNSGNVYKIGVEKHGVYKVTFEQLKKMGFDPASKNPDHFQIFGLPGGMLPQANALATDDLKELAIEIVGSEDGKFNSGDYILFYGEGPDLISFSPAKSVFNIQKNLYSDKNYYFVTLSDVPGKRITKMPQTSGGATIDTFNDYVYHESELTNVLTSGREWFGEYFFITTEYSFDFAIPQIIDGTDIKLISDVVGQSFSSTSMELFVNGTKVGEQPLPTITNSTYAPKGRHRRDTLVFSAGNVNASMRSNHTVRFNFKKATSGTSKSLLDFFQLSFVRRLAMDRNQMRFRSAASSANAITRYHVDDVTGGTMIWDITDPSSPKAHSPSRAGSTLEFTSQNNNEVEEFIAFNSTLETPELIGRIANQNLHGNITPDFLIITSSSLVPQAERLAAYRTSHGISTQVATTDAIYNEFSSGRQDVTALRNYIRFLYKKNPSKLKAVLMFGKSSYDYKKRIEGNINLVPTYESRNSLSPLETYSSDDFFAFLEDNEGEWRESPLVQNHTLDIGVGRLPVKTLTEAKDVVDKIISYESNPKMQGSWRKRFVFIADDGSNSDGFTSIHQAQANSMAETIENLNPIFNTSKLFLGTYTKTVTPTGETIPEASKDILEEFGNALVINYTGHGSEKVLADEDVVTRKTVISLKNKTYPFLVTATCEFGRHDDPTHVSTAEECILLPGAGAIGMVTTARPVNSSTNFSLNQAFYEALFEKQSGQYPPMGEIFMHTKNESMSGVSNRNFSLLSDPMLRLAMPPLDIAVTSITTASGSDVLKALSNVTITGHIKHQDGEIASDFNGIIECILYDKRTRFKTIGKNDPAFEFEQWFNPLFRGKATVDNGNFEFHFILPKNIAYDVNPGKLSLYAWDPSSFIDAAGSSTDFTIGGSEPAPTPDNRSPEVFAFMSDSTFVEGGTVPSNTKLVVRLSDDNGINISNYGIGNTMMAVLDDDEEVFLLNEHFIADTDDFTAGWVDFPIYNLTPGRHTITVKAWDTFNNPGQASISFIVGEGSGLDIVSFGNYPNPFTTSTTLFFTHTRSGEDLEGEITLLNMAGQSVKKLAISQVSSAYEVLVPVEDTEAAFGKKLPPGVYFARLSVRSISDGSKSERVTKLIVVN